MSPDEAKALALRFASERFSRGSDDDGMSPLVRFVKIEFESFRKGYWTAFFLAETNGGIKFDGSVVILVNDVTGNVELDE